MVRESFGRPLFGWSTLLFDARRTLSPAAVKVKTAYVTTVGPIVELTLPTAEPKFFICCVLVLASPVNTKNIANDDTLTIVLSMGGGRGQKAQNSESRERSGSGEIECPRKRRSASSPRGDTHERRSSRAAVSVLDIWAYSSQKKPTRNQADTPLVRRTASTKRTKRGESNDCGLSPAPRPLADLTTTQSTHQSTIMRMIEPVKLCVCVFVCFVCLCVHVLDMMVHHKSLFDDTSKHYVCHPYGPIE